MRGAVRRALTMILCLALTGCGHGADEVDQLTLDIRGRYLGLERVTARLEVEADYGQRVYAYELDLDWRREGETTISVIAPEEVAGLTARLAAGETFLDYDGVSLETGPLDESGLSPMGAGPRLLQAAAEDFIAESGLETWEEGERLRLLCRDPEGRPGEGTEYTLWFDPNTFALLRGEVSVDGRRVFACRLSEFQMEGPTEEAAPSGEK